MDAKYYKSKETSLHSVLKQSLSKVSNKDDFTRTLGVKSKEDIDCLMKDFRDIIVKVADIPQSVGEESFSCEQSTTDKKEDLIIRYHEIVESKKCIQGN